MNKTFSLTAPSRLHFGLFSIGIENGFQFGGAGAMICEPSCSIDVAPAKRLTIQGSRDGSTLDYISRWFDSNRSLIAICEKAEYLPISIDVKSHAPRHSGFGSGTQIAMSVAAALFHAFDLAIPDAQSMAKIMHRGKRSAIGTHGFLQGGFLVDQGINQAADFSPLDLRLDFPNDWRFVMFVPKNLSGVHGKLENKTFEDLIGQNSIGRNELIKLCTQEIVPAIATSQYGQLGDALFDFNRLSGQYFSQYQFGCYHSPLCAQIVEDIRGTGVKPVGQSSWGPSIFAVVENNDHANELVTNLRSSKPEIYTTSNIDITITQADNCGVSIQQ